MSPYYQGPSPLTCECPFARADRCDGSGLGDEPAPGVAGGLDDLLVGVEDAVREPSLAQILPDVFDGVQLRGARWQQDDGDVLWDVEGACRVPASAVEQQRGMGRPRLTVRAISSRWSCMACVSAKGSARAAPVPRAGQMAPNRYA